MSQGIEHRVPQQRHQDSVLPHSLISQDISRRVLNIVNPSAKRAKSATAFPFMTTGQHVPVSLAVMSTPYVQRKLACATAIIKATAKFVAQQDRPMTAIRTLVWISFVILVVALTRCAQVTTFASAVTLSAETLSMPAAFP